MSSHTAISISQQFDNLILKRVAFSVLFICGSTKTGVFKFCSPTFLRVNPVIIVGISPIASDNFVTSPSKSATHARMKFNGEEASESTSINRRALSIKDLNKSELANSFTNLVQSFSRALNIPSHDSAVFCASSAAEPLPCEYSSNI